MASGWTACAADGLGLAAAPTFLLMGLLAAADAGSLAHQHDSVTAARAQSGITAMYLLMGLFHVRYWLTRQSEAPSPLGPRGSSLRWRTNPRRSTRDVLDATAMPASAAEGSPHMKEQS